MSKKKSDIEKAIERYDAKIASLQGEISNLEMAKSMLEAIVNEKAAAKAKATKQAAKAAKPRTIKTTKASEVLAPTAEPAADPFVGVQ